MTKTIKKIKKSILLKRVSAKLAGNILLISLGFVAVFHILVIIGVVPANVIWGGQIGNAPANLIALELFALLMTALFAGIIAAKAGYINAGRFRKAVARGVWIVFAFFVLNTIGNFASGASAENWIFAPLTILLALCALRLAIER